MVAMTFRTRPDQNICVDCGEGSEEFFHPATATVFSSGVLAVSGQGANGRSAERCYAAGFWSMVYYSED